MKIILNSLMATKQLAAKIASIIPAKFVIALNGELGAGKTTLVREILYGMGVKDRVKSPTFTYVEPYSILPNITIYHFDLYRFTDIEDWFTLGFDEYFMERNICFIEWPERAHGLIPEIDWNINIVLQNSDLRELEIIANSAIGKQILEFFIK